MSDSDRDNADFLPERSDDPDLHCIRMHDEPRPAICRPITPAHMQPTTADRCTT